MCDWNQDYLPTHRETEQSSEIHIIFCVWIKPKQTKKGGKIPHDHLVEMEISGCSEIQNWFGKGFLHPFLKLPSDQFVLAAAAACLEECCRAVVLLRGLNAAPHFPLAAVNIQSESSSCVHLVKMLRSRYVWLFFFLHMLLCLYHLYHCRCLTITQTWEFPKCFLFFLHLNFLVTLWKPNSSESPSFCWRLLPLSWGEVEWWALDLRPLSAGV